MEMNRKQLNQMCERDRFKFMHGTEKDIPFVKKCNADLLAKMIMMLCQSFGRRVSCPCLFVDEVRNRSMSGNLHNTMDNCRVEYRVINFRERKSPYAHAKVGFIRPVVLMLAACVSHAFIYAVYPIVGFKRANSISRAALIAIYQNYLKALHGKYQNVYCMTDHNFYSTITCVDKHFESYVLQHGLVLDKDYYSLVLADHFLAWGKRSLEMMDYNPKVQVTGTYKFEKLKPLPPVKREQKCILYCISIMDIKTVGDKIAALLKAIAGKGYQLKVKMHPGSFYKCAELEARFAEQKLEFYKECDVADIDFDMAVIENSTILLDMLCLGKPFMIYDGKDGYFAQYSKILPWAENDDELCDAIQKALMGDFESTRAEILRNELNGGRCSIWD